VIASVASRWKEKAAILGYALNDSINAVGEARKEASDNAKAIAEDYASSLCKHNFQHCCLADCIAIVKIVQAKKWAGKAH
jgi:hypothetical protein